MKNQRVKLTVNLVVIICTLAVSLTSFLYLTYAWFSFIDFQTTDIMAIQTESGAEFNLKYFVKNYPGIDSTLGYPGPNSIVLAEDRITVDDYATDFAPIAEDPMLNAEEKIIMAAEFPGLCFTYALEVSGNFDENKIVSLLLGDYAAAPSTTFYDTTTNQGITMAKAINIYANVFDGSSDITAQANAFVVNTTPVDLFTRTAPYGPTNLTLAVDDLTLATEKLIFIFTVEFSNVSNTFYKYSYTSSGRQYYAPNATGDSNVYKNLDFAIGLLKIHVANAS